MAPATFNLHRGPRAAAEARRLVERHAGDAAPQVVADAKLLVSELVTNALQHGSRGGIEIRLGHPSAGRLRIEVSGGGRGFVPVARSRPATEPGGWGLHLVEALADRWGVRAGADQVWFEIGRLAA